MSMSKSLMCLLMFLWAPVYLYNTHRPCICCAPFQNEEGTCKYYENPVLAPIFQTRINNQQCYPVYSASQCQHCLGGVHRKRDINPRSKLYFPNPLHGDTGIKPNIPNENINFGLLHLNEDLKSIGDLLELNSDEIGYPHIAPKKEPVKLWNLDEVKSLSVPKLLPDVVLDSDNYEVVADNEPDNFRGLIDERDRKLGRFIVQDDPPIIINVGKPQSTLADHDIGNIGMTEQYIRGPSYNIPEVILENVISRKEPDFMEELQQIKQAAYTTPSYVEEPYIEEIFTAAPLIKGSITEIPYKETIVNMPVAAPSSSTTEKSNMGEDENITKAVPKEDRNKNDPRKKNKVERKLNITESTVDVDTPAALATLAAIETLAAVESPTPVENPAALEIMTPLETPATAQTPTALLASAPEKKVKSKSTKRIKEVKTNTSSRLSEYEETLLDGLLSVL